MGALAVSALDVNVGLVLLRATKIPTYSWLVGTYPAALAPEASGERGRSGGDNSRPAG